MLDSLTNLKSHDSGPAMPDGNDHPLTVDMLQIGSNEETRLQQQYDETRLQQHFDETRLQQHYDKCAILPDFWTTMANNQTQFFSNGTSLPITAQDLLKNRRLTHELTQHDIYLNLIKQEEELASQKSPPLPLMVQIKSEMDTPSPSPSDQHVYSTPQIVAYESLAQQFSATNPSPQSTHFQNSNNVFMVNSGGPEYRQGPENYYPDRNNLPDDAAIFVDRYMRQGCKNNLPAVDIPSPDSGIGELSGNLVSVTEILDSLDTEKRKSWHGRSVEVDKVNIPKIHSDVGFRYFLESPISSSQRRDDDRITYINKGQFYGVTLEYTPDPAKPLKSSTVKSVIMMMFREEKPVEEELKAWQFWHSRQHSVKQRILDADTKNSTGIVGQVEEITHNAIAFYWNPMEGPAKVNIAVQCLSTDFSNQKGVKGLPLHLQIDTFDDFRESATPYHRGYCQIKVFCDKGAERKTRDEERRAAKRKLTTGDVGSRLDGLYHVPCDRSEFYSMSDLLKPPILFTPSDDGEKMDIPFYSNSNSLMEMHNGNTRKDTDSRSSSSFTPPPKRIKLFPEDRVLLYARQESESTFQPLHIHPPTLTGLINGIEKKYNINASNMRTIFKKTKKGILISMDDAIVKHYSNEDACIIEVTKVDEEICDITLVDV